MSTSQKLRPAEAASFLGFSPSTLAKMRLRGDGPPYSKLGNRIVVYDRNDLEAWVNARKRSSTSPANDGGAFNRLGSVKHAS
jgi:predicted DNA-binding transcriptional regulator AlpA